MIQVIGGSWALFLGMFMLMIGNGVQGTLLGLRGDIEGFSTGQMSLVMAAYFAGFLVASQAVPRMIQRVGHVRVFAALASTISAVLVLYPALTEPWAWVAGRAVIGFCFCGVYITAESWLNDASTNETRGQALSVYMIVQMAGVVVAQYLITLGDVSGFVLFIIPSVLISLAFAPILLSVGVAPAFERTKPLPLGRLVRASPLASVGIFLLGGVFAAQFGMAAVYGTRAGLSVGQISFMISMTYFAALVLQFPIGWLSDRIDRRILIVALAAIGGVGAIVSAVIPNQYWLIVFSAAMVGGMSNPLYALLVAYCNDYLERSDMAAASGGLLFINGVGAVLGPLGVGWVLERVGPPGYWLILSVLMLMIAAYGLYRMTRRSRREVVASESVPYAPVAPTSTAVVHEIAQEVYIDRAPDEPEHTPAETAT